MTRGFVMPFPCQFCDENFPDEDEKEDHTIMAHHAEFNIAGQCFLCNKLACNKIVFYDHFRETHEGEFKELVEHVAERMDKPTDQVEHQLWIVEAAFKPLDKQEIMKRIIASNEMTIMMRETVDGRENAQDEEVNGEDVRSDVQSPSEAVTATSHSDAPVRVVPGIIDYYFGPQSRAKKRTADESDSSTSASKKSRETPIKSENEADQLNPPAPSSNLIIVPQVDDAETMDSPVRTNDSVRILTEQSPLDPASKFRYQKERDIKMELEDEDAPTMPTTRASQRLENAAKVNKEMNTDNLSFGDKVKAATVFLPKLLESGKKQNYQSAREAQFISDRKNVTAWHSAINIAKWKFDDGHKMELLDAFRQHLLCHEKFYLQPGPLCLLRQSYERGGEARDACLKFIQRLGEKIAKGNIFNGKQLSELITSKFARFFPNRRWPKRAGVADIEVFDDENKDEDRDPMIVHEE